YPHQYGERLGSRGVLEHRLATGAICSRIGLEIESTHFQDAKKTPKLLVGWPPTGGGGPGRFDDSEESLEGIPPVLIHASTKHRRRRWVVPEAPADSSEYVE